MPIRKLTQKEININSADFFTAELYNSRTLIDLSIKQIVRKAFEKAREGYVKQYVKETFEADAR